MRDEVLKTVLFFNMRIVLSSMFSRVFRRMEFNRKKAIGKKENPLHPFRHKIYMSLAGVSLTILSKHFVF